jgi:hypothetical protein
MMFIYLCMVSIRALSVPLTIQCQRYDVHQTPYLTKFSVPRFVKVNWSHDGLQAGQPRDQDPNSELGQEIYLLHNVQTGSGRTQIPIQSVLGALSPGVKQPGHELTLTSI